MVEYDGRSMLWDYRKGIPSTINILSEFNHSITSSCELNHILYTFFYSLPGLCFPIPLVNILVQSGLSLNHNNDSMKTRNESEMNYSKH